MNAMYSLLFVFVLALIPIFGVGGLHMETIFGYCLPITALLVFIVGFLKKILWDWGRVPVPFSIPTTAGQQKSFDPVLFKQAKFDNPSNGFETFVRMALEVLTFRTLFRNTSVVKEEVNGKPVVGYASEKWLWGAALLFHYAFLTIVIRHLRLFLEPVPAPIVFLEKMDGMLQIAAPVLYQTDILILVGLGYLLIRRFIDTKVRYISLVADYFPLFLIMAVALSGMYMRYFAKVDVVAIKELTMNMFALNFAQVPANIDLSFYVHVFFVSALLMYFPFSKLMHMGGVFLSPTRNLPNDSRAKHFENPWNPEVKVLTYEQYEKAFGPAMAEAGLPLDNPENAKEPEGE